MDDPSCSVCGAVTEDVSYVLRDCVVATSLWPQLIKIERQLGSSLLSGLLEMKQRCWEIQFRFVHREGNIPADIMAKLARQGTLAYHHYLDPPLTFGMHLK
ncbi:hypothetical protein V6N11_059505 [Hibiscus sabdariffa]|uniref:RNase H type-1 domain-containing protein n=1 Tax=Hibiscus sabdariffa TaxID=183260 RepID=A0ABR1ZA13_9ROSI